ncbi:hypothetical protein [Elizabethkingia anophelis]|uniref:Uncharacterized protein n=1 Tax=Elizabethkingia anophelis TaxID=1117645 RepID=A0A455ZH31_9FLAO|nr:hypothetical protein [Elizabethkingia anophelis]AQW90089.1 hypothetical protein BBD28_05205 [Elizabethkingia anophelis]KUY23746.1 hypothetical protein ATB94_13705 [Elizabethkingia anophelis]DAC76088.1 TPA_exp: hypothetical protein [Elizabethkingia anophelis]DAC76151.1 TPA_exp: hypothetical protein [Elizabethkingia anophelis]
MRKKEQIENRFPALPTCKKNYVTPTIDILLVDMECGIAANSAAVSPVTVGGNTEQVQTDWNGNNDTTIETPI